MGFNKNKMTLKHTSSTKAADDAMKNLPILAGEMRKSQIITTFGPGAVVDFQDFSGIIASAHYWTNVYKNGIVPKNVKIHDRNLEHLLGVKYFLSPKTKEENIYSNKRNPTKDVIAYRFPYMHYCPNCGKLDVYWRLGDPKNELKTCRHCGKKFKIIPSRFLVACINGHIEDFPFNWWVHRGQTPSDHHLSIRFNNSTGGMDSIIIHCDTCHKERTMDGCMSAKALAGYKCKGKRPWGGRSREINEDGCEASMHTVLHGASNVYYPVLRSALTIPEVRDPLYVILDDNPDIISNYQNIKNLDDNVQRSFFSINEKLKEYLKTHSFIELKDKINQYTSTTNTDYSYEQLREDEYDALCLGNYDDKDFHIEESEVPKSFTPFFEKIVKGRRLHEVLALVGFHRVLSLDLSEGENQEQGELSKFDFLRHPKGYIEPSVKDIDWLPGINMNGEGVFFKLNTKTLDKWLSTVNDRYKDMQERIPETSFMNKYFSPQYVLLHTLSHLLIKQIVKECGYSEASIKERIYSTYPDRTKQMAGILLYTTSTASDGSLGGLVRMAAPDIIEKVFRNMLDEAQWCSSDPLCLESTAQGFNSLNYAACHACALLSETCCESFNCLLDRVAIVGRHDKECNFNGFFELEKIK